MSPAEKKFNLPEDWTKFCQNSNCAVIVAHPDDETLWAGGTILMHPEVDWTIITLCRKSDSDRAPKFYRALKCLKAWGTMGDLDDGPEQIPLAASKVQEAIMELLPTEQFGVILTHSTRGEYTRHTRHEEIAQAVVALWRTNRLCCGELLTFAYEDGGGEYLPRPILGADILIQLSEKIWQKKYDIITEIYGFHENSFEAQVIPRREAFQRVKIR